jgi:hypothetical protein
LAVLLGACTLLIDRDDRIDISAFDDVSFRAKAATDGHAHHGFPVGAAQ